MNYESIFFQNDYEPPCSRSDCFACSGGRCEILTSNDFGDRECPFYKPREADYGE